MIIEEATIPYKYGEIIHLRPIQDIHKGHKCCDVQSLKKFLYDAPKHCLFIGNGDFFDSIVVTDPRYSKAMDDTESDAIVDEQIESLFDILKPIAKQILGIGMGNHEWTVVKKSGTNMIRRLCDKLSIEAKKNIPFLGYSWLFRLRFTENGSRGRTLMVRGHHGWGGGSRTIGGSLTKYSKDVTHWDADIYLYGHDHRRQDDRIPRLGAAGKTLVAKPQHIVLGGTFLKTYSNTTDPTWAETRGFPPTELGGVTIAIKPTDRHLDVKVIS